MAGAATDRRSRATGRAANEPIPGAGVANLDASQPGDIHATPGDRTVGEVITIGRQEIEAEALTKMHALTTRYAMEVSIDQVQLESLNPPEPVQESCNEVNEAQQEKEKLINTGCGI